MGMAIAALLGAVLADGKGIASLVKNNPLTSIDAERLARIDAELERLDDLALAGAAGGAGGAEEARALIQRLMKQYNISARELDAAQAEARAKLPQCAALGGGFLARKMSCAKQLLGDARTRAVEFVRQPHHRDGSRYTKKEIAIVVAKVVLSVAVVVTLLIAAGPGNILNAVLKIAEMVVNFVAGRAKALLGVTRR